MRDYEFKKTDYERLHMAIKDYFKTRKSKDPTVKVKVPTASEMAKAISTYKAGQKAVKGKMVDIGGKLKTKENVLIQFSPYQIYE